jgi:hypothetical protein
MISRPVSVTIIGWLYIVMGGFNCILHLTELNFKRPIPSDIVWAEGVNFSAIVFGVYMLRGHNWARWLALAWMAFHVVISVFHNVPEFAIHCLFLAILAYFLFRAPAGRYFRALKTAP